jgi:ABC-type dipeptide/oligopeptide/nickel transport system permease component
VVIYLTTFFLAWVAPGSPFERTDRALPKEVLNALQEKFHAKTWYQFLAWYPYRIVTAGDLGPSLNYPERTVNQIIKDHLPVSIALGATAVVFAVIGGVTIGTLAAVRRNGPLDWISLNIALIGISVPSFVAASLLIALFAVHWEVLPSNGWPPGFDWRPATLWQYVQHLILPALALSLLPMAYITRLTRVSMIDVLGADYVRTARAKGLTKPRVIWKHCLRNAILPVVSYIGPAAAGTIVGSFVVEKIFNIPGLGTFFVTSVQNRDQPLILGTVLVESALLLLVNLVVDVSYGFIDPRIDITATKGEA